MNDGQPYPKSLGKVGEKKTKSTKRLNKLKEQGFQTSNNDKILRKTTYGM